MKTTSKFEKFLINRNLLEKFKHNLEVCEDAGYHSIDELIKNTRNSLLIYSSFSWSNTPENYYFWSKLDLEWRECLAKNTL